LPAIARKLHVSSADLAEANYMTTKARVAAGQKLMVPHEATVLMAARTERPVPVAESRAIGGTTVQLAQAAATSNRVRVTYKVQQGDTLSSIARNFKTSVASIKTWNPNVAVDHITPGERLTIFARPNCAALLARSGFGPDRPLLQRPSDRVQFQRKVTVCCVSPRPVSPARRG